MKGCTHYTPAGHGMRGCGHGMSDAKGRPAGMSEEREESLEEEIHPGIHREVKARDKARRTRR